MVLLILMNIMIKNNNDCVTCDENNTENDDYHDIIDIMIARIMEMMTIMVRGTVIINMKMIMVALPPWQ